MNNEPFIIERTYKAPIDKVWKAITDKNEIKQWFLELADFKAEVGFKLQFENVKPDGTQYLCRWMVTDVVPGKKLSYTWTYDGYAAVPKVTWELFDEGGSTKVRLTHEGLEALPQDSPYIAKKNFATGWTFIMDQSLVKILADNK